MSKGYDPKCSALAEYFLEDSQPPPNTSWRERVEELAQHIQDSIESWLGSEGE